MRKILFVLPFILLSSPALAQSGCSGQAPANTWCGNNTGSQGLPTFKGLVPGSITLPGGTVLANPTTLSAVGVGSIAPILGIPGTSTGQLGFGGSTSGTATIAPQNAAGTPTLTLPNTSGTFAVGASAPLALSLTTGNLSITGLAGGILAGSGPAFTITPVLGVPASSQGTLGFAGLTSGTATITAQSTAGTPTLTLPNTTGTLADGASSPLVLSTTTGNLTCPTCVTSSGGGAITGTSPVNVTAAGVVSLQGATGSIAVGSGGTGSSFTPTPVLGVAGSVIGTEGFQNATSGTITISPPAGALGTVTNTLQAVADTFVYKATTDTLTNKTLTSPTINSGALSGTFSGAATFSGNDTFSGNNTFSGQGIFTGTSAPSSAAGNTVAMGTIVAPSLANNGQAFLYNTVVNGAILQGQGSTYDVSFADNAGSTSFGVLTGTTTAKFLGGITATGLSSGTCSSSLSLNASNQFVLTTCGAVSLNNFSSTVSANQAINQTTYASVTGLSVVQGTSGTWFATAAISLVDTGGAATINCRLTDGTTVLSEPVTTIDAANQRRSMTLSGILASPAANIVVQCKSTTTTSIVSANNGGDTKDSVLTAIRIQ